MLFKQLDCRAQRRNCFCLLPHRGQHLFLDDYALLQVTLQVGVGLVLSRKRLDVYLLLCQLFVAFRKLFLKRFDLLLQRLYGGGIVIICTHRSAELLLQTPYVAFVLLVLLFQYGDYRLVFLHLVLQILDAHLP